MQKVKSTVIIIAIALASTGCKKQPATINDYAAVPYTVSEKQIPPQIRKIFHEASKDSPIVRSELFIVGDRLLFYVFQFQEDSKLREMSISPTGKIIMVYDTPEKVDPPNF